MKSFSHSLSIILNREYNTQLSLPWLNICRISNPLARDWIYQDSPMFSLCVRGCSALQFSTYFFTVCSCSLGTRWQGESWGLSSCTSFRPVRDSSSGPGPDITNYSSEELGHAYNLKLSMVTSSTLSCRPTTLTPNHSHDIQYIIYAMGSRQELRPWTAPGGYIFAWCLYISPVTETTCMISPLLMSNTVEGGSIEKEDEGLFIKSLL